MNFVDLDTNRAFANSTLFALKYFADGSEQGPMSADERNSWPTYSNASIVTPMITGYDTPLLNLVHAIEGEITAPLRTGTFCASHNVHAALMTPVSHNSQDTHKTSRLS